MSPFGRFKMPFGAWYVPAAATTTTRSTIVRSKKYALARSVNDVVVTMTTGRVGVLSRRETLTITSAPAESLATVDSMSPSDGRVRAPPGLAVTLGMFFRPLARAAVTMLVQPEALAFRSIQN